jgi:hypothetical protein
VKHADLKRHLAAYLEGELPIGERALVDAHLDDCSVCAAEVEEMLQTIRLVRRLPEPETPAMISANVMRRIRAGETQLGFFGRVGRVLSSVLEPGFVLPASAIAAAALVVAVVQGMGAFPTMTVSVESEFPWIRRVEPSVASIASPLTATRRGERRRRHVASNASDPMEIVARVERRASQAGRTLQSTRGQRTPATVDRSGVRSGTRIRIEFQGLGLAQQSKSPQTTAALPFAGPTLAPRIPGVWAANEFGLSSGATLVGTSPGMLVVAERLGPANSMANSGQWPQSIAHGGTYPRDAWLALGFEDPAEFARYIAAQNLAEQELWTARLSERAEGRGLLDEFLQRLRESGDPAAAWVADDFAAQAATRVGHDSSEAEVPR